jgi:flavin reductase (DIM6/NTAB) family NADH-FMN oxidoreductase RutF
MFSANQTPSAHQKDTVVNAETTGVFCWNLATYDLREAVNVTAEQVAYGVDEFERAGLEKVDSQIVQVTVKGVKQKVPMVKASPVRFECEYYSTLRLPGNPPMGSVDVVIGKVVGIYIDEAVLTEGKIDVAKTMPIARCGYYDYAVVRETFEMKMPGEGVAVLAGLEGSVRVNRELGREKDEGAK